jgi:hypothetical protein
MIKKYYFINIKKDNKRKKDLEEELNKKKIKNYKVIDAVTPLSDSLIENYKFDNLRKYPPCIRTQCGLKKNKACECPTNILIKTQIACLLSFKKIMKLIVDENINGLIGVGEDDIRLHHNYNNIINVLINEENFKLKNINVNKPLLISCLNSLDKDYLKKKFNDDKPDITVNNKTVMSNPLFIINKEFAYLFLKNFNLHDVADRYIHKHLPKLEPTINYYIITPYLAYDTSYINFKTTKKEINEFIKTKKILYYSNIHHKIKKDQNLKINTCDDIKYIIHNTNKRILVLINTHNHKLIKNKLFNYIINIITNIYFKNNNIYFSFILNNNNNNNINKDYFILECTLILENNINCSRIKELKEKLYEPGYQKHEFFNNLNDLLSYYNNLITYYKSTDFKNQSAIDPIIK